MEIQKRNKDLTQIVDENWKANHNYDKVRELKQKDKQFIDKMFNVKNPNTNNINHPNYIQKNLDRLNNNINAVRNANINNRNNFR